MKLLVSRPYMLAELAILSAGLPVLILAFDLQKLMLPVILTVALYCMLIRRTVDGARVRPDWQWHAVNWQNLRPILLRFVVCAVAITALTLILFPDKLFSFIGSMPWLWALVIVLYPILSVVAQEVIYRWFFMARYQTIFTTERNLIVASGVAFAIGHIIFNHWLAPLLCLFGGVMFAATYAKTRSLALVSIEHALYGDFIFTIGLGSYFYHGGAH
jgi:hypothetical protein